MINISRREAVSKMVAGGAGVALMFDAGEFTRAQTGTPSARAFGGQHQPRPLIFDPAKLKVLYEKLIRSHWENNYGGAVKALNAVELRLAAMLKEKDLP